MLIGRGLAVVKLTLEPAFGGTNGFGFALVGVARMNAFQAG